LPEKKLKTTTKYKPAVNYCSGRPKKLKIKGCLQLSAPNGNQSQSYEEPVSYEITQCRPPPDTSERAHLNHSQAGPYSI